MKVAHIMPPNYIGFASDGYHMALGQWLVQYPEYAAWMQEAARRGSFVLVDNGAAEPEDERVPFGQIVEAFLRLRLDEIIFPDVIEDGEQTMELTANALHEFGSDIPSRQIMLVPQGRDWHEWILCAKLMHDIFRFRTIGVPKHTERWPGGRSHGLRLLEEEGLFTDHDVHLLGVWGLPAQEILNVARYNRKVRGIDTGAAYAYAQRNEDISQVVVRRSLETDIPLHDNSLLRANIRYLREWANYDAE